MAKPSGVSILLAAALVVSVGYNFVQSRRAKDASAGTPTTAGSGAGSGSGTGTGSGTGSSSGSSGSGTGTGGGPSTGTATDSATATGTCEDRLRATQAELDKAQARLEPHMPPGERFDRAAPNPELEATYRDSLARIFAKGKWAGVDYVLECRGQLCRVQIIDRGATDPWMQSLQEDEGFMRSVGKVTFQPGTPTNDVATGEAVQQTDIFIEPPEANDAAAMDWLQQFWQDFATAQTLASCGSGARGDVEVKLDLAAGKLTTSVGGDLGATPVGTCVRRALDTAVAGANPPNATAVVFRKLTFPL